MYRVPMKIPCFWDCRPARSAATIGAMTQSTGGAMNGFTLKRIDDLASIDHGAVKLAGDELGVQSFGLQVLDLPAGFTDYPEHDHVHDGQEEVYVVLVGSAEVTVAGEPVEAEVGSLVRVEPESRRRLAPGPDGVRLLVIGCTPGGAYERPEAFRVAARA
jgi:mannose-6-phosphate isomerase-like protein (cupin superfamily)